jgi:hypothetical protein
MVMKERPLAGVLLPEGMRDNIEATGKEELLVVDKGPECKHVEVGHVIRPHGVIGKLNVDGVDYRICHEDQLSCHIGEGK